MRTGETTRETKGGTMESRPRRSVEAHRPEYGSRQERLFRDGGTDRLARALGWLSLGIGLAEVAAPQRLSRMIGLAAPYGQGRLMRVLGLRELASGAGLLRGRQPGGWLWSRVGGDVMNLGLLRRAHAFPGANPRRLMTTTLAVAGVAALDMLARERARRRTVEHGIRVRRSITIDRSPAEIYQALHDLSKLPEVFQHLESVQVTGERRSHWKAKGPAGTTIEWDAELVDDQPNRRMAWRSLPGARVPNRGIVELAPASGGRGTVVHVDLEYDPPAGALGAAVARLFGQEPGQQIAADLRRLKQRLETGEIATAQGPAARRRRTLFSRTEAPTEQEEGRP